MACDSFSLFDVSVFIREMGLENVLCEIDRDRRSIHLMDSLMPLMKRMLGTLMPSTYWHWESISSLEGTAKVVTGFVGRSAPGKTSANLHSRSAWC